MEANRVARLGRWSDRETGTRLERHLSMYMHAASTADSRSYGTKPLATDYS